MSAAWKSIRIHLTEQFTYFGEREVTNSAQSVWRLYR